MEIIAGNIATSSMTHTGCVRKINEDAFLSMPESGLWAVADGMGGHQAGDYASLCVISHLTEAGLKYQGLELVCQIKNTLQAANLELFEYAQKLSPDSVVGTTVVVLVMEGEHYHCFWSGDSRCYLLRANQFKSITRDHTEAEELLANGSYTKQQLLKNPDAHRLTEAIGIDKQSRVEHIEDYIYEKDRFLLCTDGLNKVFSDHELSSYMTNDNIDKINQFFLNGALHAGAPDNLSSIIVSL